MQRSNSCVALYLAFAILSLTNPAQAQQAPIDPRVPPPPPFEEEILNPPSRRGGLLIPLEPPVLPAVPATVFVPAGTRIAVILDSPLSTRISKAGQAVTFRTANPLPVADSLELPPETAFIGKVVRVKRPGAFGRPGELRVTVERIELASSSSIPVVARLDSPDHSQGRISADNSRAANLYNVGLWTLQGTLFGTQISGGKGAAIGAGAGAAIGLILLMAQRGPDVYLEPGMPFLILLDETLELPGAAVQAAQLAHARAYGLDSADTLSEGAGSEFRRNPDKAVLDSDRPKLKHRPKNPKP